jgi:hypothetical protein
LRERAARQSNAISAKIVKEVLLQEINQGKDIPETLS